MMISLFQSQWVGPQRGVLGAVCAAFLLAGCQTAPMPGMALSGQLTPQTSIPGLAPSPVSPDDVILPRPIRTVSVRTQVPITLPGGGQVMVETSSVLTQKFQNIVPQEYDFSCGAAAVATLLTYHYGVETTEEEVFKAMFAVGDPDKIKAQGFSLLDLKRYLEARGLRANGFSVTLDELQREGVPAIQLINLRGYFHFVVIKGINDEEVLVGDPALGIGKYSRAEFERMRANDIAFVILDQPSIGRMSFDTSAQYRVTSAAPGTNAFKEHDILSVRDIFQRTPDDFVFQSVQ